MNYQDLTLDEAADALAFVIPEDRATWVKMGMALRTEFGDDAFDIWDQWSAGGSTYDKAAVKTTWRSFRRGGVGIGSLIMAAQEGGFTFARGELGKEEKAKRKRDAEARRKARLAEIEADEAEAAEWHRINAEFAAGLFPYLDDTVGSDYLKRKQVRPHNLLMVKQAVIIVTHFEPKRIELITGKAEIDAFFERQRRGELDRNMLSFRFLKRKTLAVAMRDPRGVLWSWQFIDEAGGKYFLRFARKSGLFHHIRSGNSGQPVAIVEGYATGASVHEATGWSVAVAFDAGNLAPVAQSLRELLGPGRLLVICADNDAATKGNPGVSAARQAAKLVDACVAVPQFDEVAA